MVTGQLAPFSSVGCKATAPSMKVNPVSISNTNKVIQ
jgi:hypothetical protein